jgi:RNA polymerase sigma-70 factor (ECF subfamily)
MRDDTHLVARMREGDVSALGVLYDKYRLPIFQMALAITRDRQASEEILRECFLALNTRAGMTDHDFQVVPWLYRTAVELSYNWVTRHSKWWASLEGLIDRFDRLVAPMLAAPDAQLDMKAVQENIDRAIDSLPFSQRIVVILYYLGGLSLKEIAYILECPIGTAKSRLHYGRETLRRHFTHRAERLQAVTASELARPTG